MRELTVSATGVVRIDAGRESEIRVNAENLIAMIERMIAAAHPKTDYHDQFAGRETITVELLVLLAEQEKIYIVPERPSTGEEDEIRRIMAVHQNTLTLRDTLRHRRKGY